MDQFCIKQKRNTFLTYNYLKYKNNNDTLLISAKQLQIIFYSLIKITV